MDVCRPPNAKLVCEQSSQRAQFLLPIVELVRQASIPGEVMKRGFALGDSGSTGADHNPETPLAIVLNRAIDRSSDLRQCSQCHLIVAAPCDDVQMADCRQRQLGIDAAQGQQSSRRILLRQRNAALPCIQQPLFHLLTGIP